VSCCVLTDVSPHLVFKNGMTPTLWPQDVPYPPDTEKDDAASTFGGGEDGSSQQADQRGSGQCFSPDALQQYPQFSLNLREIVESLSI